MLPGTLCNGNGPDLSLQLSCTLFVAEKETLTAFSKLATSKVTSDISSSRHKWIQIFSKSSPKIVTKNWDFLGDFPFNWIIILFIRCWNQLKAWESDRNREVMRKTLHGCPEKLLLTGAKICSDGNRIPGKSWRQHWRDMHCHRKNGIFKSESWDARQGEECQFRGRHD